MRSPPRELLRRSLSFSAFGLLPLVPVAATLALALHGQLYDFQVFYHAGRSALHLRSPYPQPTAQAVSSEHVFVYPAPMAFLMAPFSLLPLPLASLLFDALLVAATLGALLLLGVRDRRVLAVCFLGPPLYISLLVGAVSPLLALGLAVAWRYRSRARVLGLAVGAVVVAKVFLWPLFAWLLVTRRFRAAAWAWLSGAALTAACWSALGFQGLSDYPRLLSLLSDVVGRGSYSLSATLEASGLATGAATGAAWLACGLLLATLPRLARREDGDRLAFTVAIAAAFLFSPVLWPHYLVLAFVPLAIAKPRFSPIWLLPLLLWLTPAQSHGVLWSAALGLAVALALLLAALELPRRQPAPVLQEA